MSKPTFRQVLRYRFDNFMSKGGKSIFVSLFVAFIAALVFVMIIRGVVMAFGPPVQHEGNVFHHLYISFLEMTDPGNMAQDIHSSPWYKIPGILAGVLGIILLSMLIGFITTFLVQKLEDLRKGHSKVIEDDHSLILGWDEQQVVEILRELVLANESEDDPSVVILADEPKEEMDDFLGLSFPESQRLNTRIVTRSGSTSSPTNLQIAAVDTCRSVIVLATASEEDNRDAKNISDARAIKTILAVANTREEGEELNIVAEIFDPKHHQIVQESCPHPITVADANDILAKIIVQTSRSVGLSIAYSEILSFAGCEMYFYAADWGDLDFGSAQYRFPDGVPLGVRKLDGEILINPPIGLKMEAGLEVLILANDDSTIEFLQEPVAAARDLPLKEGRLEQHIESELIIGWNRKGRIIIEQYADYVLKGSRIDIIVRNPCARVQSEIEQLDANLPDIKISLHDRDPLQIETLADLEPGKRDNIIILTGTDETHTAEEADSHTILILLLLRKVFEEAEFDNGLPRLITEVMDSRNQGLISKAGVKDFIVSNRFISMMLAQISEEADIKRVYDSLFEEDGSEIYLKPASLYFEKCPAEVSFADCMGIAQKRAEVCIGLKIKALEENEDENFGVKLIPVKTERFTLREHDCLVVVSEDET
jgi:hypothetical protein